MRIEEFIKIINCDFYTGVPDSQLKALCNYLMNKYGIDGQHHIIAANEGNAASLAAGYHLATAQVPVVYMQNSGLGNIINPAASLLNNSIYGIPMIFIIGWRGEPDVKDEPQHIFQGKITLKLLEDMDIEYFVISPTTTHQELAAVMQKFNNILQAGKQTAFVIKKGAFDYDREVFYSNSNHMTRESVIERITHFSKEDLIISTTGKASRELYEIRERRHQSHKYDFLTVGSMGHASSIALGIALNNPVQRIWCIDGDGAALMHLGAIALIGANQPSNYKHIIINNSSHETVGGMPTVAESINLCEIAKACGYQTAVSARNYAELDKALKRASEERELCMIEIKCSIGSRKDLGRPITTPKENKAAFVKYISAAPCHPTMSS